MTNRYEALLVLNTQGKDDTLKEVVDRLESEFEKEGAKIEQVQRWISGNSPTLPANWTRDTM